MSLIMIKLAVPLISLLVGFAFVSAPRMEAPVGEAMVIPANEAGVRLGVVEMDVIPEAAEEVPAAPEAPVPVEPETGDPEPVKE